MDIRVCGGPIKVMWEFLTVGKFGASHLHIIEESTVYNIYFNVYGILIYTYMFIY